MQSIQGFINISSLVVNVPGRNSPIGELSTYSRTFSKEKGEYVDMTDPGIQLITFSSTDLSGNLVEVPQPLVNEIIGVARLALKYASEHTRPYNTDDFQGTLQQEIQSYAVDFAMGPLVDGFSDISLPAFLSWRSISQGDVSVHIWLADAYFAEQFGGYEITVIPPLVNLNSFFNTYESVVAQLDQFSISEMGDKIQLYKNKNPETAVRLMEFNFVNRFNTSVMKKTVWGILVYGPEGDNDDAIKDAIIDHLLNNSTQGQEQWEAIFPEIFRRTEMVVIPRWDKKAVINLSDRSTLYSSVVDPQEVVTFAQNFVDFYPTEHVRTNLNIVPYPYKTICLNIVNGIKNLTGKKKFTEIYPDYLPIPSTSLDFARMTLPTQNLILTLDRLLLSAETATTATPLPEGFRRIKRGTKLFVATSLNSITFLVAAKTNAQFGT